MNKRTILLIFLLVVIVALLSYLAVLQSLEQNMKKQEVSTKTNTPSTKTDPSLLPDTTLMASPSAMLLKTKDVQTVEILIDTGKNNIITAQVEMAYNPKYVDVVKVVPGDFFDKPQVLLNDVDKTTGRIRLALGSITPKKGNGSLLQITIAAKTPTTGAPTEITFLPKTQVLGNSNQNVNSLVKQTSKSQLIIQ